MRAAAFVDVSATAGALFDHGKTVDWESVASADFDDDGCVDLAVAPLRTFRNRPWTVRYRDQIRILRNRCNGVRRFVGLHVPATPETRLDVRVVDADGVEGPSRSAATREVSSARLPIDTI